MKRSIVIAGVWVLFGFAFGRVVSPERVRERQAVRETVNAVEATSLSVVDHSAEYPTAKRYSVVHTRQAGTKEQGVTPPKSGLVVEFRTDSGLIKTLVCQPAAE